MGLTAKQALHAKPGRHSDGRGLYLLVKPSGSKSWVLRVQYQGQRRDFGLGGFTADPIPTGLPIEKRKTLTLNEAREKARIGRELAKAGLIEARAVEDPRFSPNDMERRAQAILARLIPELDGD